VKQVAVRRLLQSKNRKIPGKRAVMDAASDLPQVVVRPPRLLLAALAVGLLLDHVLPQPGWGEAWFGSGLRYGGGGGLLILGILLMGWAMGRFRAAATPVPTWQPTSALVTAGPYRHTRNPIYIGLLLIYVGLAVLLASRWSLSFAVPLFLVLHFGVVVREEAYLEAKFGDPYRRYRVEVRRWL
jgi:protein-S-isoprenylcysteine O-methyltransferase Ste14